MSDEIAGMAVKLAMDDSSFTTGISDLKRQLNVLDSGFKVSMSNSENFGKSLDGLKTKATSLGEKIEVQKDIVQKYSEQLNKSKAILEENSKTMMDLKDKVAKAKDAWEESTITMGENTEVSVKLKNEYQNLEKEYESQEKLVSKNSKSVDGYTIQTNKQQTALNNLQNELQKTNKEIEIQSSNWAKIADKLETVGKTLESTGRKVSDVGQSMTMGLTLPIVGVGTAAAKMSIDFENSLAAVSTIADTTQTSMGDLSKGVIKLSDDTGKSADDLSQGLYEAISSGVQTGDALNFMGTASKAAIGGFTDTTTAVDGLTTVLNSFGLKASEANNIANQMIITQNLGKTTLGELANEMGNVAPTAAAANVSTKDLFSSLAVLTANGMKTQVAVTSVKSALSNIIKPSSEASTEAEKLGLQFNAAHLKSVGWQKFLEEVKDKTKGNTTEMATLFGSVEALNSVLTLTSNQGMDLYSQSMQQMSSGTNYADDAFNKMNDTTGNKLQKSLNELKNAGIQLGESLTPVIVEISKDAKALADSFNSLSPEMRTFVVNAGLVVAAGGPILSFVGGFMKVGGGAINIVSNLSKGIAGLATAGTVAATATEGVGVAAGTAAVGAGGLATTLGGLALSAAPWLLAGAAIVSTGVAINHELSKEVVPSVNLFADQVSKTSKRIKDSNGNIQTSFDTTTIKISDSTKKSVGAYIKMDDDVKKTLSDLYVNSTVITAQTTTSLETKYAEMNSNIKAGMDKHYTEELTTIQIFFNNSSALSTTEETKALANLKKSNDDKKVAEDEYNKQIQAILKKASDDKRALTLDEQQQINSIQDKMKTNAINSLSDNEVQAKVILQRIKDYGANITAEQASDEIKNANKARDGSVQAANDQYNKTVAAIIQMRDGTHSITSDQADKLIADAKRQKEESIKHAEELRSTAVEKVTSMNKDIGNSVNTTTGNVLTWWDKLKSWWNNWFPAPKTLTINQQYSSSGMPYGNTSAQKSPTYNVMANGYATGTDNATEGLHWVGEEGPELMYLPQGSKVYSNNDSMNMVNGISNKSSDSSKIWGNDLTQGIADGINQGVGIVRDAATNIADSIYKILHFSVPDEGPLADAGTYGLDFMQLLADTINQNSDKPTEAASKVAQLVSEKIQGIKNNTASAVNSLYEDLVKLGQQEQIALSGVMGSQRYSILEEYNEKRNAINQEIDLRRQQADKEIAEIQRIGQMNKDELQKEIQDRKDFATNINNLDSQIVNALKQKYSEEQKVQEDNLNQQLNNLDNWKNESEKAIDDVANAKIASLQAESNALDEQQKMQDRADSNQNDLDNINKLKSAITYEHNDYNKAELEKQLNQTTADYNKKLQQQAIDDKKSSLQKQMDSIKADADSQKQSIENIYNSQKTYLQKGLDDLKTFYDKKLSDANLNAEAEKMIMQNNQEDIVTLLNSYGDQYKQAGQTLGERLAEGFQPAIDNIKGMIASINAEISSARDSALAAMQISGAAASAIINSSSNTSINNSNTTNKNIVNNNVEIISPIAQTPSQQTTSMMNTLQKLAFQML